MKNFKFLFLIIPVLFFLSCSGNNSTETTKNSDNSNSSATNSSGNEAHFYCIIDGQPVSGGIIDDGLQQTNGYQSNVAYIVDVDQGKELLFYLSDPKNTNSRGVHSLRFAVPDKTGSMSYGPEEDGWGIEVDIKNTDGKEATYFSDSFTIDVTTLSSTRTGGTFSGKFKIREDALSPDYKKEIEVTDGKFDIPMKQ
jgi:hypothetical protein